MEGREERVRGLGEVLTGGPRGVREREAETGDVRRCGESLTGRPGLSVEDACYRHKLTGLIYGPKAKWA